MQWNVSTPWSTILWLSEWRALHHWKWISRAWAWKLHITCQHWSSEHAGCRHSNALRKAHLTQEINSNLYCCCFHCWTGDYSWETHMNMYFLSRSDFIPSGLLTSGRMSSFLMFWWSPKYGWFLPIWFPLFESNLPIPPVKSPPPILSKLPYCCPICWFTYYKSLM